MVVHSWRQLVRDPAASRHVVQLYREPEFLATAVAAWAAEPLRGEGGALLLGTLEHAALIRARLAHEGLDAGRLEASGRLRFVEAEAVLAELMRDGRPDRGRFMAIVEAHLSAVRAACRGPQPDVRAWGELVNLLWLRGDRGSARALEAFWNDVIAREGLRLLCSYRVDNLAPETHAGALKEICSTHSHLIPEEDEPRFDLAVRRALVDLFGDAEAPAVQALLENRRAFAAEMPAAEALLVALHDLEPQLGERLLQATRFHLASLRAAIPGSN